MMNSKPIHLIQITDTHLFESEEAELLGVNTTQSLKAVLALIAKNGLPDVFLLTGDLVQERSRQAYERIIELFTPFERPVYYISGNHDYPELIQEVFPQGMFANHKHIIFKHWQLILLDSQIPGKVPGYLDAKQLEFLHDCLSAYPMLHAMIVLHHHPIPVHAQWLDQLSLQNKEAFWSNLINHKANLRAMNLQTNQVIVFGHVHQEYAYQEQGIWCYATPSSCVQFKRLQNHFGIEHLPPGYRQFYLHEDGSWTSRVHRLEHYVGVFEEHAKGY